MALIGCFSEATIDHVEPRVYFLSLKRMFEIPEALCG
jgi:hypothetical protein